MDFWTYMRFRWIEAGVGMIAAIVAAIVYYVIERRRDRRHGRK